MAREIKGFDPKRPQCWAAKEEPYECVIEALSENKSASEIIQITKDFEESHSYLLICEFGRATPFAILDIYNAERESGVSGFIREVRKNMPSLCVD